MECHKGFFVAHFKDVSPMKTWWFSIAMLVFFGGTWRIIPVNRWLITMVRGLTGPGYSPSKWPNFMAYRGDRNYLLSGVPSSK